MTKTYSRQLNQRMKMLKDYLLSNKNESVDFKIMMKASSNLYSPEELDKHSKARYKRIKAQDSEMLSKMFLY